MSKDMVLRRRQASVELVYPDQDCWNKRTKRECARILERILERSAAVKLSLCMVEMASSRELERAESDDRGSSSSDDACASPRSQDDALPVVPGLNWRSRGPLGSLAKSSLAKSSSRLWGSPRSSKSGRTSNRSHASHDTARKDVRPLHQIAEVLGMQDEAREKLRAASKDAAQRAREVGKAAHELNECVKEFVSTEANYLQDLQHTCGTFVEPLRALIPAQMHYTIFSNLAQLNQLHKGLGTDLSQAKEKISSDTGQACVDAFSKLLPYFKM